MLRSSSKRAVSSTSTVTCLPCSAARCRLATSGEPCAGAIERLLDREHRGIVRRLAPPASARDRTRRTDGAAACRVHRGCRTGRGLRLPAGRPARAGDRAALRGPAARPGPSGSAYRAAPAAGTHPRRPDRVCSSSDSTQARRTPSLQFRAARRRCGAGARTSLSTSSSCVRPPSSSSSSSASRLRRMHAASWMAWPGNSRERCSRMMSSSRTNDDRLRIATRGRGASGRAGPGRWQAGCARRRRSARGRGPDSG